MMDEWICLECSRVFYANESFAKCCGKIEKFDPVKHAQKLVGLSNSWIQVWDRWKDDKRLQGISQELNNDGINGAAHHLNAFIESLE
jgi:hypothetical protein